MVICSVNVQNCCSTKRQRDTYYVRPANDRSRGTVVCFSALCHAVRRLPRSHRSEVGPTCNASPGSRESTWLYYPAYVVTLCLCVNGHIKSSTNTSKVSQPAIYEEEHSLASSASGTSPGGYRNQSTIYHRLCRMEATDSASSCRQPCTSYVVEAELATTT